MILQEGILDFSHQLKGIRYTVTNPSSLAFLASPHSSVAVEWPTRCVDDDAQSSCTREATKAYFWTKRIYLGVKNLMSHSCRRTVPQELMKTTISSESFGRKLTWIFQRLWAFARSDELLRQEEKEVRGVEVLHCAEKRPGSGQEFDPCATSRGSVQEINTTLHHISRTSKRGCASPEVSQHFAGTVLEFFFFFFLFLPVALMYRSTQFFYHRSAAWRTALGLAVARCSIYT